MCSLCPFLRGTLRGVGGARQGLTAGPPVWAGRRLVQAAGHLSQGARRYTPALHMPLGTANFVLQHGTAGSTTPWTTARSWTCAATLGCRACWSRWLGRASGQWVRPSQQATPRRPPRCHRSRRHRRGRPSRGAACLARRAALGGLQGCSYTRFLLLWLFALAVDWAARPESSSSGLAGLPWPVKAWSGASF